MKIKTIEEGAQDMKEEMVGGSLERICSRGINACTGKGVEKEGGGGGGGVGGSGQHPGTLTVELPPPDPVPPWPVSDPVQS